MPIRFSTEAANADVLGDDSEPSGRRMPATPGAGGPPRNRFERGHGVAAGTAGGEPKPGKDINAAGFIKDKDSSKP
jgi:hypothetical protein